MRLYTVTLLLLVLFYRPSYGTWSHTQVKNAVNRMEGLMSENMRLLKHHDEWQARWLKKDAQYYASIDTMNRKIAGIEQFMKKIEEGGRIQLQKITDAVNNLEMRLLSVVNSVESKLSTLLSRPVVVQQKPVEDRSAEIINKVSKTESVLMKEVAGLKLESNSMASMLKNDSMCQSEKIKVVSGKLFDIAGQIGNMENFVRALEKASQRVKDPPQKPIPDPRPAIEEQTRTLKDLKKLLDDTSDRIKKIPIAKEVTSLHNGCLAALQKSTDAITNSMIREVAAVKEKILKFKDETTHSVSQLRVDLSNNTVGVKQELHNFGKGQSVMADQVLDAKKRVENGVHQMLAKVGDIVNFQGDSIKNMLNLRFDGISNYIMVNQSRAVANLTTKMEQEMHQLWQQINVVSQQMTENATALDKIHKQDAAYVNCTTSTIGGMENKVGEITKRMAELDGNLNDLLGRVSLATQKFNEMKSGLVATLDGIKTSFKEVQEKSNGLSNRCPNSVPNNSKDPEKTKMITEITHPDDLIGPFKNVPSN